MAQLGENALPSEYSVVTHDMIFEICSEEGIFYRESPEGPADGRLTDNEGLGQAIFLKNKGNYEKPPLGIRSAVPLGGTNKSP